MISRHLLKSTFIQNVLKSNFSLSSLKHADVSLKRTHYCGELDVKNEGQIVVLTGWLQTKRFSNFLVLRDLQGLVQVCLDEEFFQKNPTVRVDDFTNESVLAVKGLVRKRPQGQENKAMKTGHIEVECTQLEVINPASEQLPFTISQFNRANEAVRMQYRYLDLRFSEMQQNLIMRSNFVHKCRQFLIENNFIDIETPTLFRRTPGGAREFIVPTNKPEMFYCLTQSPQQFKQLLMIAGMDKYFQIARCYRDESSKPDRQPEFTQLDIEMSFIDDQDCINLIEALLRASWPLADAPLVLPFQRMKFNDAMRLYGNDKPDMRFDMRFSDITNLFNGRKADILKLDSISSTENFKAYAFKIPLSTGVDKLGLDKIEKEYRSIFKSAFSHLPSQPANDSFLFLTLNKNLGNNISKYLNSDLRADIYKQLDVTDEVVVLLAAQKETKLLEILGKLRLSIADMLDRQNVLLDPKCALLRDPKVFKFLWVVDFPLFSRNEETNEIESTHHPFTAPIKEHESLVNEMKDLDQVIGLHYDLVLNGEEIGGGSIRVHNAKLQRHILENVLKEDSSQLEHLLKALELGAPNHGGIALGIDRLTALIAGTSNIRNVIAFPKAQSGRDLLSAAPAQVPLKELEHYKIKCVKEE